MILRMFKDLEVKLTSDIIDTALLYDASIKLKNDDNLYKIVKYDDYKLYLDNNKIVNYSDVEIIQHKLSESIYATDYNYLDGNNYNNIDSILICKNNISPKNKTIDLTIGATYSLLNYNKNSIDDRIKVSITNDSDIVVTIDYEYFFKTYNELRDEKINQILD